jgi:predicted outer membrane protein
MFGSATGRLVGAWLLAVGIGVGAVNAQGSDSSFVSQAALANMAEIQLGHLAVKKAENADVKKFAQMMIEDHVKAQQDLADAASGAGIQWPKQLDDKHKQIHQRLSSLSADRFDREYMKTMIDGHRTVEAMLAARVDVGGARPSAGSKTEEALTANVNKWATKTLPSVRAHLREAEQVTGALDKGERSSRR